MSQLFYPFLGIPRFMLPLLILVALVVLLALFLYFRRSSSGRQIVRDLTGSDPTHEVLADLRDAQERALQTLPTAEQELERAQARVDELRRAAGLSEEEA